MHQRSLRAPIDASGEGVAAARGEADEATRGSAIKLGAETAGRILSLATTLLLARQLGPTDFGFFAALAGAAVILAEAADLGLQATASRALVARSFSLRVLVRAKLGLTVVVFAALAALFPFARLLAVLVLYFTLAGWSEVLGVALRAFGRRGAEAAVILCLRAFGLVGVLAVAPGPLAFAGALAASTLPAIVLGALLLSRRPTPRPTGEDPTLPALLRSSLPLGVNGWLSLLGLRLEVMGLGFLRGAEAGLYAAALRVVEAALLVPSAVAAGAMPALTREALRGSGPVRERTAATAALLAVPAAVGLALVAPGLVGLLFGAPFAPAAVPLRILALALVPLFMNGILLHALIAAGRAGRLPRLTAVRVAVAAVLASALLPAFGAVGAAVGFTAAETVLLVLAARACASEGFPVPVLRPLVVAAGGSIPMALAVALAGAGPLSAVALGVVVYGATLAVARFAPRLSRRPAADVHCG